jgi:uncharacterized protein (TIGR00255 family)
MSSEVLSGKLFVFAAPSGAGKTTLVHAVVAKHQEDLRFSISYTTREPRSNEANAVDYLFVHVDEFMRLRDAGEMLEYAQVFDNYYATSRSQIEKLDVEADPARLEVELAFIAQKIDVDEELDRLESHLVEIRSAIAGEKAVGRRLDFLMQELNREANTLGSKSADTETTKAAVDLKVLIEQMREQIQNVE